jgi:hypothetical protein
MLSSFSGASALRLYVHFLHTLSSFVIHFFSPVIL